MDEFVNEFSSKNEHRCNDEEKNLLITALDHAHRVHGA